ncbi:MAG: penicillin-binding protein 2 [Clostridia bacterium]|nr:penicillin-binding protein 2 [Clostridia bacterium]
MAQSRGMIYDRNMIPLVNREISAVLIVNPTENAMTTLYRCLTQTEYAEAVEKSKKGSPFLLYTRNYSGDCDDITEMTVYSRYSDSDVLSHIIGYLDSEGNGASGLEKSFDSLMDKNSGTLSVRYRADATGKMLRGEGFEVASDNYASSAGLVLTVDYEIQSVCENIMEYNNIESGAVVVLDAATGEILALASSPEFDREDMSASLADENSPFLNRALSSYAVGSVFKPVVAAAALEQGISEDLIFTCDGYVTVNGIRFNCHKKDGHGTVSMTEAMAVSCNSYFIQLGQLVGAENILHTASQLGFGSKITLADSIVSVAGILPDIADIDSSASLANLSFGQGTLLATPLQIGAVYCAFVNGGYYREPYILKEITDENGEIQAYYESETNNKVLTDSVCKKIRSMLEETVASGSGKLAAPMENEAAGKTATAETGWTENGREIVHTWFAGYYPADEPQYVIVVFKEDGVSSSTECAPIFRDIVDNISHKTEK